MIGQAQRLLTEAALLLRGELKHSTVSNYTKKDDDSPREIETHRVASITYSEIDFPEHIQFIETDSAKFVFGGMEVHSTNVLRVISELESAYQMLKYLGFEEDMNILEEIKGRYYKMYFKLVKQEKSLLE